MAVAVPLVGLLPVALKIFCGWGCVGGADGAVCESGAAGADALGESAGEGGRTMATGTDALGAGAGGVAALEVESTRGEEVFDPDQGCFAVTEEDEVLGGVMERR